MIIDPKQFGLSSRSVIEKVDENNYNLVINRKSRIIMKDGTAIVEKIQKVKGVLPDAVVSLKIAGPICSKTLAFLKDHGIEVLSAS